MNQIIPRRGFSLRMLRGGVRIAYLMLGLGNCGALAANVHHFSHWQEGAIVALDPSHARLVLDPAGAAKTRTTIVWNAHTRFLAGKRPVSAPALRVDDRVRVETVANWGRRLARLIVIENPRS